MNFLVNLVKKSDKLNNVTENVYFSLAGFFLLRKIRKRVFGKLLLFYFLQLNLIIKLLNSIFFLLTYLPYTVYHPGKLPSPEVMP